MRRFIKAGLVSLLAAGALVIPATSASADSLCNANRDVYVWTYPGSGVAYVIPKGGGWHWVTTYFFAGGEVYSYGHGNGHSNGYVHQNDGQPQPWYNCHGI